LCGVRSRAGAHLAPEAALRQKQIELIEKFAAQNGPAVIIRDTGLNATFRKKPGQESKRTWMHETATAPRGNWNLQTKLRLP
jgi:hypothetical protein